MHLDGMEDCMHYQSDSLALFAVKSFCLKAFLNSGQQGEYCYLQSSCHRDTVLHKLFRYLFVLGTFPCDQLKTIHLLLS